MSDRNREKPGGRRKNHALLLGRRSHRRALWAAVAVAMSMLGSIGCGEDFVAAEAVGECAEVATQCRLADGPLGVCERRSCGVDESPPCFVCTPQH